MPRLPTVYVSCKYLLRKKHWEIGNHRTWFPSNQNERAYGHSKIHRELCCFCFPLFLHGLERCLVHSTCSIYIYWMDESAYSLITQSLADCKDIDVTSKFPTWRHKAGRSWAQSHRHKSLCVIKASPGHGRSEPMDFNCHLLPQSFLTPKEWTLSLDVFVIVPSFWHSKRRRLV